MNSNNAFRRGVSSVLAMIFLAIVASLTSVMAIVSEGNVRSAESAIHVSRSLSAAESGLKAAMWRLRRECSRFIVEAGDLEGGFGDRLWTGTWVGADGTVDVQPASGYTPLVTSGTGLMYAVYDAHLWHDDHNVVFDEAGASVDAVLDEANNIVTSQGIPLHDGSNPPWYQLRYEMLADGSGVRVTSRGMVGDIQRLVQMDFLLEKRIEYALLGQSRIMIGKNVLVEGPIGVLYGTEAGELTPDNGDPLVLRSDFYDLDPVTLDPLLDALHAMVASDDVDGDGRLRPGHATEGIALSGNPDLQDHDSDQYVDDFDLFLGVFDADDDDMVVFDPSAAQAAGWGVLADEFDADDDLAALLDETAPDRNDDGLINAMDTALGYNDGILDGRDRYAKVRGHLNFAVDAASWETARGASWQSRVEGVVRPSGSTASASFSVGDPWLLSLTSDMFLNSTTWYETKAGLGASFASQVTANGGWSGETTSPEGVPWGSAGAYDLFDRPVYRNMTFGDMAIPMGTNALFVDCSFVGVTWIEPPRPVLISIGITLVPARWARAVCRNFASLTSRPLQERLSTPIPARFRTIFASMGAHSLAHSVGIDRWNTRTGGTRCNSPATRVSTSTRMMLICWPSPTRRPCRRCSWPCPSLIAKKWLEQACYCRAGRLMSVTSKAIRAQL